MRTVPPGGGIIIGLMLSVPFWAMVGCAAQKPLDACHAWARDIAIVCADRQSLCGSSKVYCPGDTVKIGGSSW